MVDEMTLPEIFVQLPEDVQVALERELEKSVVGTITPQSVYIAAELITERLKNADYPSVSFEVRNLLDQVPQAVVDTLF